MDGVHAAAHAQGWLLGFAAVALFLHAARDRPIVPSLAAAALFAFHPLSLAMVSVLSYASLSVLFVTVATLALVRALEGSGRRVSWVLAAGALWGAATLVRPTSLILPPFILLLARWVLGKGSWRRSLAFTALFTAGMTLVVAPHTIRNYRLTGRIIPVNAQDGFQLWGLSATRNAGGGGREWVDLWQSKGAPLFARATGTPYSLVAMYRHTVTANDAFRSEAARNIRQHPEHFARNALINFGLFNADPMTTWLDDLRFPRAAKWLTVALILVGAVGLFRGLRAGRTDARVIASVYVMLACAHSLGFLLPRYGYVRLPLVLMAVPMALPAPAVLGLAVALAASTASVAALPPPHAFRSFVSELARNQAVECGRGSNCPDSVVTRAQMAVFLLAAREDAGYAPPACVTPRFTDVPCRHPLAPWINDLAARGISAGCGDGTRYCPELPVNREQMAVFLLKAREGPAWAGSPCREPVFADVPCSSPYAPYVNELAARSIISGCGAGNYCPFYGVTRAQLSVFLRATFGLN
jgi:hypothetical protein